MGSKLTVFNFKRMDWRESMKMQIKEASRVRRIRAELKNFALDLLEIELRFNLIYSSSRDTYTGLVVREKPNKEQSKFILKNYGTKTYKSIK